jgi:hypothetical protein
VILAVEAMDRATIECDAHGSAFETYICEHLAANPIQTWFSSARTEADPWPDAWCSICHDAYQREGLWNEKNEAHLRIKLFCHLCYEAHRMLGDHIEVPD